MSKRVRFPLCIGMFVFSSVRGGASRVLASVAGFLLFFCFAWIPSEFLPPAFDVRPRRTRCDTEITGCSVPSAVHTQQTPGSGTFYLPFLSLCSRASAMNQRGTKLFASFFLFSITYFDVRVRQTIFVLFRRNTLTKANLPIKHRGI